jgi:rubrerythrin
MVWLYVVVGLVVIIAILLLMKSDTRLKGRLTRRTELLTDVTYVCMRCGHSFRGSRCPKCGSERKPIDFGR